MWYYDKYIQESSLSTVLLSNRGGSRYSEMVCKGFIDKIPEVKATHEWEVAGQGWSRATIAALKNVAFKSAKAGEQAYANLINHIKGENADQDTLLGDVVLMSNGALLKKYGGTNVDISIPQFYAYFIKDTVKGQKVRDIINTILTNYKLLGSYEVGENDTTAFPPNDFKYVENYHDTTNVKGSFCLVNSNFILPNLLPNQINIEYSDTVIADGGGPLFGKLTIDFEYGRRPVPNTIKNFINGPDFSADSYINIGKLGSNLNSIMNRSTGG